MIAKQLRPLVLVTPLTLAFSGLYAQQTPKAATQATIDHNQRMINQLPLSNKQAFSDTDRGFIAALPDKGVIYNAKGRKVWDLGKFSFIKAEEAPSTVNPSLWRQAQLIVKSGLYKVSPGIYQVRSADLSNITFIEGQKSLVIVDPLISTETAKAALDLYYKHRPKKPIVAVIYTHSHVDHYGGVKGVVSEEEVKAGKVKIVAPQGFTEAAVAENVMAGNAMSRRASYMYGNLLPESVTGQVGAGLGVTTSTGTISLIPPTDVIEHNGQKLQLAGMEFIFHMAPDSEAPAEMFFYIPKYKALCTAEDATHTLHNTYSLRGAKIRDPLAWSKYLNEVLYLWGEKTEVLFAPHHWPVWTSNQIVKHLKSQRDLYRYINDQTLNMANQGYTMTQIAERIQLPKALSDNWSNRGYYGTINHNTKATYVKYLGWFSGNPATLHPLPPVAASKKFIEYMGGADAVIIKARQDYAKGNYRWVAQVMNHVVFANPDNQVAKELEADALEQLGYQAESGPWRNFYLSGAKELRQGVKAIAAPVTASPDTIAAMNLGLLFDYLSVKLDAKKAANQQMVFNFTFPDTDEQYVLELQNGIINHIKGYQSKSADATVTLDRTTLNQLIEKSLPVDKAMQQGLVTIKGDKEKLKQWLTFLDTFNFWFNIVTPNK